MTDAAREGASGDAARANSRSRTSVDRIAVAVVALVASVAIAVGAGEHVSFRRAIEDSASIDHAILLSVRLPRVLLGVVAGAGLSATGAAFQGLLRNPLAEPYVLGVAGGAALGATIAIAFGVGPALFARLLGGSSATASAVLGTGTNAIAAALGGLLATALVYLLAARGFGRDRRGFFHGDGRSTSILLAGVVVNAIAGAAITFIKTVVRASTAQQLLFWLAGFLDVPTTGALLAVSIAVFGGCAVLVVDAPKLNLLSLGDEQAAHLGVDVRALERRVVISSSVVVGAVVATCGILSFVGLLVPHIVRKLVGHDHRALIPASMVVGGAALVLCDVGARLTFRALGTEPPVGAITALLGGPVFLFLLARQGGSRGAAGARIAPRAP